MPCRKVLYKGAYLGWFLGFSSGPPLIICLQKFSSQALESMKNTSGKCRSGFAASFNPSRLFTTSSGMEHGETEKHWYIAILLPFSQLTFLPYIAQWLNDWILVCIRSISSFFANYLIVHVHASSEHNQLFSHSSNNAGSWSHFWSYGLCVNLSYFIMHSVI